MPKLQRFGEYYLRWKKLSRQRKLLIFEILKYSILSKIQLHLLSFKDLSKVFGRIDNNTGESFSSQNTEEIKNIFNLLNKISKHLPWEVKCLLKCHTASHSLRKRKQPFVTKFGVKASSESKFPVDAHAWIEINEELSLERPPDDSLTPIARYVYEGHS